MLTNQMLRLVDSKLAEVRRQLNQNVASLLKLARIAHDCESLLGIIIPSREQLKKLDVQLEGLVGNALTPDDLTLMLDAQSIKKTYKDPSENSDYITARLLLDKSNASIVCAKYTITEALELYSSALNAERNQVNSSSRSHINQLNHQLNIEKNSTKGSDKLRSILWITFGIIALICWIIVLASSSNGLIFIWYLIAGAFCIVIFGLYWGIGTEIIAAIINFVSYGNKKVEIQASISHVTKKAEMALSDLEQREENLIKAKQILTSCIKELES